MRLIWVLLLAGMIGCKHATPRQLASEQMLRTRCAQLRATCDVQWKARGETTFEWMASASTGRKTGYQSSDYWFAFEPTREEAIDRLYVYLGGSPTNPGDPLPEIIYRDEGER